MPHVTILPLGRTLEVGPGTLLRDALQAAHIPLDYPCGGRGSCRQCRVKVDPPPEAGTEGLREADRAAGLRLACRLPVQADCAVTIPDARASRRAWMQGLRNQDVEVALSSASVRRVPVDLAVPDLTDQLADWDRLCRGLDGLGIAAGEPDPASLEHLSATLRENGWKVEAVAEDNRLVCLRPRAGGRVVGFAVDLGTTTVDLALLDLESGERLSRRAFLNGQVAFGADVISRAQSFHDDRAPVRRRPCAPSRKGPSACCRRRGWRRAASPRPSWWATPS